MVSEPLDVNVLRAEHRRASGEASAYIGLAHMNRSRPEVDAAYMRKAHTMDRIAELIAEEIDCAAAAGATQEGEGDG